MLIFTMPPPSLVSGRSGELFAAWHDGRNGDWDVFLRRSTDSGRTWDEATRLNDDPPGNGRHQYLPRLSVAPDGRLDAIFYDRRNDPQNIQNDVYFTLAKDGERRFVPNLRITSEASNSLIGQRYTVRSATDMYEFGSRLALVSTRTAAFAAWTDTRNYLTGYKTQDIVGAGMSVGQP